ncbi:zinc-binding dehydrogenase [Streptomyces sp. CHD11]|uniref:zinc-binding dehydrogenase n=1 Tax=Streptomyces sp. CHD11 TaxID=2741325 RepID=UPI001BFC679E|nr:zinc-binding dehydrogenase [Streptomyces sp. CHD11]
MEITGGKGADVAFECAGVQPVFDTLLGALKPGGTLQVLALYGKAPTLDMMSVLRKEVRIQGTMAYAGDHPGAIRMVREGPHRPRPLHHPEDRRRGPREGGDATARRPQGRGGQDPRPHVGAAEGGDHRVTGVSVSVFTASASGQGWSPGPGTIGGGRSTSMRRARAGARGSGTRWTGSGRFPRC